MLLWEVVRVTQYSISLGAMWEVWSRNLTNLFVTPLRLQEYLLAAVISGAVKAFVILSVVSLISFALFDFTITDVGIANLALAFVNLSIFSVAVGLAILGVVFRYGTRIQALAWGIIFLFQPLTAVYFPVATLPAVLVAVAHASRRPTSSRWRATTSATRRVQWDMVLVPFALNLVYLALALWFFNVMYMASRRSGQFAKLGT